MSVLRALAGVAFAAMAAQAQLTVSLATMSTERPTEIEATIANAGKEELSLLTLGTILDSKPVKKVTVIDEDGAEVPFLGFAMEYDHEALESQHFETLKPGSSVKRIINIASAHDLEAGTYTILADGSVFAAEKKSTLSYKSNTITVSIKEPSTAEIRETLEKRTVFDGADCTDEQRTATANGIKNCEKLARAAAADVIDPKSTRVFEYFKTNSSETRALLNHRFLRVADECSRTDAGDTHVLCTDMYGECTANGPLIAYTVWVNGYVTLCPMFYETRPPLPEACHKQDHATTLIHEMTHARAVFEPDVATQDLAYSYENVTKLDTDHALNNADSYSLYANAVYMNC